MKLHRLEEIQLDLFPMEDHAILFPFKKDEQKEVVEELVKCMELLRCSDLDEVFPMVEILLMGSESSLEEIREMMNEDREDIAGKT